MRIINVVSIFSGNIDWIVSFPILETHIYSNRVKEAEDYLFKILEERGITLNEEEKDMTLEDGIFEYGKNELLLTWSDVKL